MTRSAFISTTIDAPPETIWNVMLDLRRYGDWNPFIFEVRGAPDTVVVGSAFQLRVRWQKGGTATSGEQVTRVDPPTRSGARLTAAFAYRFTGPLDTLGFVRATRIQSLEQAEPHAPVIYRSEEVFRGLLHHFVPLAQVQAGFEAHAKALKARAESLR